MLPADLIVFTAIGYVGLLFVIAFLGDRRARLGRTGFLRSPFVYTLAISVYCTSWTFYGSVGSAARSGLEYLAIYMGPTIVFIGWWFLLRRLVRISHEQRITSIADLLSSRFGKSSRLAVLVTVIAVIGIAPYIALQLKAVTSSIQAIAGASGGGAVSSIEEVWLALGIAAGMAVFTILFGTRNVDAKEQHHGVVAAIAFEAIVKLAALVAIGLFVIAAGGGLEQIFAKAEAAGVDIYTTDDFGSRWVALNVLSAAAVLCLPRQFQITVVENSNESHLRTAGWAFPLYLLLMSLFTLPIALYGLVALPPGSNPDMFVLTVPLNAGQGGLALLAFIGGFSSATSMIIIESIALSIMVSNHIVMPLLLRATQGRGPARGQSVSALLLNARRFSILLILTLGFLYFYLTRNSGALAPIGLISFTGVAQFAPAILAALFWRSATLKGAIAGVSIGFVVWAWSSFLPSFGGSSPEVAALLAQGPWNIGWLRPEALFGLEGLDPLVHAMFWSLFLNATALVGVSLVTSQSPLELVQASAFVDVFRRGAGRSLQLVRGGATAADLFFVVSRVLGTDRAEALFQAEAQQLGVGRDELLPSAEFIDRLERELAGLIGAASAHVMLSKVVSGDDISLEEMMRMADETQQAIEYSQQLERTSSELRSTAAKLEAANAQLLALDQQKDDFLSQVSHEVRTPMTAIRAFSEILREDDIAPNDRQRMVETIHRESLRLTRLLDEILDLSALERGERSFEVGPIDAEQSLDSALVVCEALARQRGVTLRTRREPGRAEVTGEANRLTQVLINLVSNAIKYNSSAAPWVEVASRVVDGHHVIEVSDNGPGIAAEDAGRIFDKFYRGGGTGSGQSGAGLGLAISREIIASMSGTLSLVRREGGASFRISLPVAQATAKTP